MSHFSIKITYNVDDTMLKVDLRTIVYKEKDWPEDHRKVMQKYRCDQTKSGLGWKRKQRQEC